MSSDDEFDDDLSFWDSIPAETFSQLDHQAQRRPPASQLIKPGRGQLPPPPQQQQAKRAPPLPARQPGPAQHAPPPTPTQHPPPRANQDHRAPVVPPFGTARPPSILRPAQPPKNLKRPRPASASVSGAEKDNEEQQKKPHPRASLNERGEVGWVDPNPWKGRGVGVGFGSTGAGAGGAGGRREDPGRVQEEDEEEEDLPEITLVDGRAAVVVPPSSLSAAKEAKEAATEKGATYRAEPQRGVTVSVSRPLAAQQSPAQMAPPPPRPAVPAPVQRSGMEESEEEKARKEKEKREVEELRRANEALQHQLAASQRAKEQLQSELCTKAGENAIVRKRLTKAEAAHADALKQEKRDRQMLQDQLAEKEKEYKAAMDRMRMEDAFRRQELATASSSRRSSSQRPPPSAQSQAQGQGLPFIPAASSARFYAASPSPRRTPRTRAASAAPQVGGPPPQPSFGAGGSGFNAPAPAPAGGAGFAPSQGQSQKRRAGPEREREREGSMGPPKVARVSANGGRVAPGREGRERGKGKGKARLVLDDEEEFFAAGDMGGTDDTSGDGDADEGDTTIRATAPVLEAVEEDEGGPSWEWLAPPRDDRAELVAAVFAHTSLAPLDVEPAGQVQPAGTGRASSGAGTAAGASGTFSVLSARPSATLAQASARPSGRTAAPPVAPPPQPAGPTPTLHALLNLHFPPQTPGHLVQHYELTCRAVFTLLGRGLDHPPPASGMLDDLPLALPLAKHLSTLAALLDAARLVGPLTALLALLASLVFLSPEFAAACVAAEGTLPPPQQDKEKDKTERVALLPLLARIIARYGRPDPPSSSSSSAAGTGGGRLGPSGTPFLAGGGGALDRQPFARSRKARLARPSLTGAGSRGGAEKSATEDRVPLEEAKRVRLVDCAVGVVEGVAWRCVVEAEGEAGAGAGERVRRAEDAFIAFVKTPSAVATLLDPQQSVGLLLAGVRLLALLACRPPLFRPLLGTKFLDAPDTRNSKLPLVDRIATLLVLPRAESVPAHHLSLALLSLSLRLLAKHEDAIMLVAQSASFVPELLGRMWRDARTLWEWDGREVAGAVGEELRRTTHRLSTLLHLLYYLAFSPHTTLTISDLLSPSLPADAPHPRQQYQPQAVTDLFMAAVGTVAFATLGAGEDGALPSWCLEEGWEGERRKLVEMGYLAQELLEDISPLELEEIEVCFGPIDGDVEGEDEDEEEEEEEGDVEMEVGVDGREQRESGRRETVEESQV
ncbi:hypothetical protein JCM10207_005701 [Rhodosporidiobolus poonsookiae]